MPNQTLPRSIAVLSVVLVLAGVFSPLLSVPIVGSINYIQNGRGDGVLVLAVAVASAVFVWANRKTPALVAAATCAGIVLFTLTGLLKILHFMRAELHRSLEGNPFAALGESMANAFQLQWGWPFLILGVVGLLVASALTAGRGANASPRVGVVPSVIAAGLMAAGVGLGLGFSSHAMARTPMARTHVAPASQAGEAVTRAPSAFDALLDSARDEAARFEERAYQTMVKVRNVRVAESVVGGQGVFGEVENSGGRSLDEVEITIYFLGAAGRPVHEAKYHPVLASTFAFGDANAPLKPGYTRTFGVRADDAPSNWSGSVRVSVTSVEFSKR